MEIFHCLPAIIHVFVLFSNCFILILIPILDFPNIDRLHGLYQLQNYFHRCVTFTLSYFDDPGVTTLAVRIFGCNFIE